MLRESAARLVRDQSPLKALRALRNAGSKDGFSRDFWAKLAEQGLTAVLIPEEDGGLGLGHAEAGIVQQELGRNLALSPFLSTSVGAVAALKQSDARGHWLEKIAAADAVAALALDEAPKHKPERVGLTATKAGAGFKLNGEKSFVALGGVADLLIVSARTSGGRDETAGITLFAVDARASGLERQALAMIDASNAAKLSFRNVEVGVEAVLGGVGKGWETLSAVLDAVRLGAAAELLGVAWCAFDMTLGYLKERKQFGQVIGAFQGLQHRAAHLRAEMEVTASAIRKAQNLLDAGGEKATQAVSVAKAMACTTATLAVQEGVQMHGGIGMTDEHDIGFTMKRARVLTELYGDENYHADRLAKLNGY